MNKHQVSGHEVDGAHALEFNYNWDMENDQQDIDGDNGEYQRGSCDDKDGGEDQQAIHYADKDQQVIHNDNEDGDKGQCSQPDRYHAQHLLPSPPRSCADSVVLVMVDGASGTVELLGEHPNHIVVFQGNELVSITTLFPCSLHFIFFAGGNILQSP